MREGELKSGAQVIHSVFGQQSDKLKTLKQISVKFHTIRYLKCQNMLYVTGFIIVFVPVCRIFSRKLSMTST